MLTREGGLTIIRFGTWSDKTSFIRIEAKANSYISVSLKFDAASILSLSFPFT